MRLEERPGEGTPAMHCVRPWAMALRTLRLGTAATLLALAPAWAQDQRGPVRDVRAIRAAKRGFPTPAGIAYSPRAEAFLVLRAYPQQGLLGSELHWITMGGDPRGSVRLARAITSPLDLAFDAKAGRLLILDAQGGELIAVSAGRDGNLDPARQVRFAAGHLGVVDPQGLTVDPASGRLFVLDRAGPWLLRIEPDEEGGFDTASVSRVDLGHLGLTDPRGLAFDPTTGHLHVLTGAKWTLYELTEEADLVATRDLSGFGLFDPRGMVFAPSGDQTDDPGRVSLYVADTGRRGPPASARTAVGGTAPVGVGPAPQTGGIVELSLIAAPAPAASSFTSNLVATTLTSTFNPPNPDPSGITYLPATGTLWECDGEVEEMTIFAGGQVWEMTLGGSELSTHNVQSFTNEPTGVTVNPVNQHLFYSDDVTQRVFDVDPGSDGLYHTGDDTVTSFSTSAFGSGDPEDVVYDPSEGVLFVDDGVNAEIYRVSPGANGVFDGVPSSGDDVVTHFDTSVLGVTDPEGITLSDYGSLYIVGQPATRVAEITKSGTLVQTIDISAANAKKPAGLAYAPGSLDASTKHLYIVDRGVDNDTDPNENDGKMYEVTLADGNQAPAVNAGPDQTITLPSSANLDGTVNDEGLPDPPAAVTTTWSKVSGPGTVSFANPNAVDTTASFSTPGTYVVRLTASDSLLSSSADATVTVSPPPNQAPVVSAGPDRAVTLPNSATLDGTVSDDGLPDPPAAVTTAWSKVSGPGTVSFANPNAVDTTASFSAAGVYALRLGANDGALSASDVVVVTVDAPAGTLFFSLASYKVSEAGPWATIMVSRTGGSASGVSVGYQTSDGSAQAGSDYTTMAGTLSFGPNAMSASFTVPIANDGLIEGDEAVLLRLFSPGGGAGLGFPNTAVLTIADNDLGGAILFSSASYSVNESLSSATITVTRTGGTGGPVTVSYQTSGGTATPGSDYTTASGVLTFAAGQASRTFTLPITLDGDDEDNETVGMQLSAPGGGATLGSRSAATLTIVDNDTSGSVQFGLAGYTVDEAGGSATITATRSGGSAGPVTVDYLTANGSAQAGSDYTAAAGTLTFGPGVLSQSFVVPIANDGSVEGPETVDLTLANPTNRLKLGARKTAVLTITDDEPEVTLHFSAPSYSVTEGSLATVTVKRSGPTGSALTVDYQTSNGSALAGSDYTAAAGTLSFDAGISTLTFTVTTTGDSVDESDEELSLALATPTGGAMLGTQAVATLKILDNDSAGALKFSAATYSRSEAFSTATITVSRAGGLASGVTVNYASLTEVSAGKAVAGTDYTPVSGNLSFAAGQTKTTFTVPILADDIDEDNESLALELTNPTGGATLGSPTTTSLTIVDNDTDGVFQFSLSGYSVAEGGGSATITVTRSGGKAGPLIVLNYQTSDGTAQAGSDYMATSGTLSFGAGVVSQTFPVVVVDDGTVEGSETVNLALSNPSGKARLGARSTAVLAITDNEPSPTLHFSAPSFSVAEGALGVVTVKRSGSTSSAVSVQYQTSDGSATSAGGDYTVTSGTLSFKAGVSTLAFKVPTTGDSVDESNETLNLALSNPTGGASLGTQGAATLTIVDNDAGGALKFGAASYSKTESGPTATITVTRTGGVASGVTVSYASADGTAQAGSDYTAASGTLAFAAGQKNRTFTVTLTNDSLDEANETLTLNLSAPTAGATLDSPASATLTILDNDVAGTVWFSGSSYSVGESGGVATITLTRSGGMAGGVTVNYATSNGTATAGSDYTAASGTLTFGAGETTKTFTVSITPDASAEANETVVLTLGALGGGAALGSPSTATLYIVDDE